MIGRNLGAVTANVNNKQYLEFQANKIPTEPVIPSAESSTGNNGISSLSSISAQRSRTTLVSSQSVAAVAEMEWDKQGISFVSRFEKINDSLGTNDSGSTLIAETIKQSLIFDQYDLVTMQQNSKISDKMQRIENSSTLSPKSR